MVIVTILGFTPRDIEPEVKFANSGDPYISFSVGSPNGEGKDPTYYDVVVKDTYLIEYLEKAGCIKKSTNLLVTGDLVCREEEYNGKWRAHRTVYATMIRKQPPYAKREER